VGWLLQEETNRIKMATILKREKRMRLILQQTGGDANPARLQLMVCSKSKMSPRIHANLHESSTD
jgi:hypothetical protein